MWSESLLIVRVLKLISHNLFNFQKNPPEPDTVSLVLKVKRKELFLQDMKIFASFMFGKTVERCSDGV